jgi:hypothetical protein
MKNLERRVQRLEAERSGDEEVTLEQAILWSYRLEDEPFDPETQRQYDEFCRRCERSKLGRLFEEAGSGRAPESAPSIASDRSASATALAAPVEPAVVAPEPAPLSWADPVFEEYGPNALIKAVPGMRLDVLMAMQRK